MTEMLKKRGRPASKAKTALKSVTKPKVHSAELSYAANQKVTESDREKVRRMAGLGVRMADMAYVMGVSQATFYRKYTEDARHGRIELNMEVVQTTIDMIRSKNHPALNIFWLKTRCGWSDYSPAQMEDELKNADNIDLSLLSEEQLRELNKLLAIARGDRQTNKQREDAEVSS